MTKKNMEKTQRKMFDRLSLINGEFSRLLIVEDFLSGLTVESFTSSPILQDYMSEFNTVFYSPEFGLIVED